MTGCEALRGAAVAVVAAVEAHGYHGAIPADVRATVERLAALLDVHQPALRLGCPDGGTCHHGCMSGCFRVRCCAPLSGVFPGDEWPAAITAAEAAAG